MKFESKMLVVGFYNNESCPVFTLNIVKALTKYDVEIEVLLPTNVTNKNDWDAIGDRVLCHYVDVHRGLSKTLKILNAIHIALLLLKLHKFDYIIYTFYHPFNSIVSSLCQGKKVLFLHDPKPHSGESEARKKKMYLQARRMDGLVVLTRQFKQYVAEHYRFEPEKICFYPLKPLVTEKHITRYPNDKPIHFLFFGRIELYKGLDVLLKAYSEVQGKDSVLEIAGNGDIKPYSEQLKKLSGVFVQNRYIEDKEIVDLFTKDNTILCVPYRDATQSGPISIAINFGVPVIASDVGGLREQLGNGKAGLFFDPGNIEELEKLLREVIANPSLRTEEAENMLNLKASLDGEEDARELLEWLSRL